MDADRLIDVLDATADAVVDVFAHQHSWGLAGTRPGQYVSDLAADEAALDVLDAAGLGALSEESAATRSDRAIVVVVDPLDGSTNASLGLPWYATSLCAVDDSGPLAAVVHHHGTRRRYRAIRGGGATLDGAALHAPEPPPLADAVVAVNGLPAGSFGWWQYRAMGAAALDICGVADGTFAAYVDVTTDSLGPWDYLGAMLVCSEVGVPIVDVDGRDLCVLDHAARRTPIAAADDDLLAELLSARIEAA